MKRSVVTVVAFLVSLLPSMVAADAETPKVMAGEYVVERTGDTPPTTDKYYVAQKLPSGNLEVVKTGARPQGDIESLQVQERRVVPLDAARAAQDCAEILKDPTVKFCEPSFIYSAYILPNDSHFSLQWGIHSLFANWEADTP